MSTPVGAPGPADHWDAVFRATGPSDVSWFQSDPTMSLRLLASIRPRPTSIIDVGAGASVLVDALLERGVAELAVLDVSDVALGLLRHRLADDAQRVRFVRADVLQWTPDRQWDVWHDRALFHFLVDREEQQQYVATVTSAVRPGGCVVIGGFAHDGPSQCSGRPTARHDAVEIARAFGDGFRLERSERELHRTPADAEQAFTWVVLRRSP